jgi:hypothetical protein
LRDAPPIKALFLLAQPAPAQAGVVASISGIIFIRSIFAIFSDIIILYYRNNIKCFGSFFKEKY